MGHNLDVLNLADFITDYALATECILFAVILFRRAGDGSRAAINGLFAWLFTALAAASAFGGTYHAFFDGKESALAFPLWIATLLAIGAMTFINWLIAARIQCGGFGRRVVSMIAVAQFVCFTIFVIFVSPAFMWASLGTIPAMLFLLVGYVRALAAGRDRRIVLGVLGLLTAFAGAALQQMHIGIHPDYFSHNALYHVIQFVALMLIYVSIRGIATRCD